MCKPAAERRKNVATPKGRGFGIAPQISRGAAKDSFAAPQLIRLRTQTTAFSRGYVLSPLRGWFLVVLPIFATFAFAQTKPGNTDNGKRLFIRNGCYQCHGTVGQGGLAGPRLAQTKLTLTGFTSAIRNPRPSNMPPYRSKVMSDQELADVFSYIQSLPAPVPLADIPILNESSRESK